MVMHSVTRRQSSGRLHLQTVAQSGLKSSLYNGGKRVFTMSGCDCLNTCSFSPCKLQTAVMVGILAINCRAGRDGGRDKAGRKLISALSSESVSFLASDEGNGFGKRCLGREQAHFQLLLSDKTKQTCLPPPASRGEREKARKQGQASWFHCF